MNRHGSMNRIYRLVWSQVCNAWVPVAETAKGRGKSGREQSIRNRNVLAAAVSLALAPLTQASPSATPCVASGCAAVAVTGQPAGGRVVSGIGRITQSGSTTDIQQSSQDLTIDWLSFSIGSEQTVNFLQPSAAAVAVNQILSANGSQILGHLNANGQVWLINPNGVLFGRGAEVDVGGLVASTLEVSDASPSGTARGFGGAGTGSVVNQGTITAANGGYVALLGNEVGNQGVITAKLGTVALGAGGAVTLTFDGSSLVRMQVDQSSLNDLAANGGLIAADGGRVMMTAGARDALLASVVNNTGVIQARTVQNHAGTISLLGGMMAGTVNVGGTLDASAPQGGNGGFIETSAAHVEVANAARVTSLAAAGKTGTWLIDPTDFTVAPTGGDISGATLGSDLNATNFTLLSSNGASPVTGGGSGGNINVNDTVSWSANTTLTLTAANNVNVNGSITASGATAGLAINPNTANGGETASGTGTFNLGAGATVNLPNVSPTSSTALVIGGTPYTVINSLGAAGSVTGTDLQGLNGNPAGYYALGSNINATATSSWNGGAGFTPIGNSTTPFSGIFDGLGHTISSLTINLPTAYNVGLFGYGASPAVIRNVGLIGASVTGEGEVGGLVGGNIGTISNSHATGSVSGATGDLGGLVGFNNGTVSTSYAAGTVSGSSYVGGLVGYNAGSVNRSYAAGAVSGASEVGGLVGGNVGTISNSYASGSVSGSSYAIGGLVGYNASTGTLTNSYATGSVSGPYRVGGLVGYNDGLVNGGFATGTVGSAGSNSSLEDGGLVGYNDSAGTIINSYATGSVSGPVAVNAAADGGLVGGNAGTVSNSYATGGVSGYQSVGGLVGGSSGTIDNSYATGLVNGSLIIGGLVGGNSGSISNSYAMGGVSGVSQVGGLVGYNLSGGKISNSNAAGSVNGSSYVGGLVGYNGSTGTISYSFATGSVSGAAGADYVGGLVGDNAGTISNSNAAGSVNGSSYVGGLVGYNGSTGTISYSFATGSVSGAAGADYLGGLVGDNAGTISNSYAAGTIQAGGADYLVDVGGAEYVGGLVGYNTGSITNSSATGSMTAATGSVDLGGLVGANAGTISGSYATGWVQAGGADDVGGLVGYNLSSGTINNSYATGLIQAGGEVYQIYGCVYLSGMCYELPPTYSPPVFIGGLVGYNAGAITNSYALSYVTGFGGANYVGGLVGGNYGSVTSSYAKGLVTTYGIGSVMGDIYGQTYFLTYPPYYTGGLVGYNAGSITNSYAAGGVVGNGWIGSTQAYPYAGSYGSYGVGGLVGRNSGSITNSYATGAVSGSYGVGGLVGYNLSGGKISNSYAVGSVIGARSNGYYSNAVGGLAGYNYGTISNSYSTGSVSGAGVYGNYYVGGLTGYNSGTVSSSFWDITTSGQTTSPGGAGLTDAQMQSAASFTGWSIAATGGSGDVWRIYPGQTYPLLLSFMTPLTLANTTVTYNGSVQSGAATTASGVLGSPTSGTNAGGYDTGYYSAQQGYDISGGTLTIEQLASVAWVGGATGNWSTASNWAGGAIPDLSNVAAVTIPKGKTVTYDSGVEGPTMLTTLTDSGNLVMAAGDLSITGNLSTAGYQQTGGTLDVAGALTIKSTSGGVTLGDITAGTLSISSKAGAITQLAATMLDVTGTTTLTADNGLTGAGAVDYAITLANGGNQFVGAVTSTGSNIDLAQGAGGVVLGATLATGTLTVDSLGGAITQSAGKTLAVTGTTSLTSDNGTGGFDAITLGQAGNNFGGAVTADGSAVTLKDAAALTAVLDSSGAATLTSVGAMDVSGTVGTTLKTTTTGTNAATTFGATTVDTSLAVTSTGTVTETSSNILKVDGKGTTTVSNPKVTVNGVKGAKIPGS